jgi:leucyl aminopeptidase
VAPCALPAPPTILECSLTQVPTNMKTTISLFTPAGVDTEALVAVVLDHADPAQKEKNKDAKPQLKVASTDAAVQAVAADLLASGEVAGKPFETNLLHKPASLKAKRLLLISGGSAKKFTSYDLRRLAGVAVRTRDPQLCVYRSGWHSR